MEKAAIAEMMLIMPVQICMSAMSLFQSVVPRF